MTERETLNLRANTTLFLTRFLEEVLQQNEQTKQAENSKNNNSVQTRGEGWL